MKTVLFTFDYELFLGTRSGKPGDCILDPSRRLLDLFRTYDFKAVFFIDTVHLLRLKEIAPQYPAAAKDWEDIKQQLKEIVREGHEVFPHIHAHWLDAVYLSDENEWELKNTRYYQFSSLPRAQQLELFDGSMALLNDLARPVKPSYSADAYRAGGWSVQPFCHFKPFFRQYGIIHEWSVIPGKYLASDAHSFDFRKAPADHPVYRFEEDPAVPDTKGGFLEWTISTIDLTPLEKWFNFKVSGLLRRLGRIVPAKGRTVSSGTKVEGDAYQRGRGTRMVASFEGLNPFTLRKYLSAIRRNDYFHFISHPKLLTSYEFTMIEQLLRTLKKNGGIQSDFRLVVV